MGVWLHLGTLRYRDEDGGESEGQRWLGEDTAEQACPGSTDAVLRPCSELSESAWKQDGELLNVELIHKQESLVEVMEGQWTMILLPGPLLHSHSEPFLRQLRQGQAQPSLSPSKGAPSGQPYAPPQWSPLRPSPYMCRGGRSDETWTAGAQHHLVVVQQENRNRPLCLLFLGGRGEAGCGVYMCMGPWLYGCAHICKEYGCVWR